MPYVTPVVASHRALAPAPVSSGSEHAKPAPKKDTALRVDIFVRSAEHPAEPGALSIEGEGVSKAINALCSWSSAVQALLGALASLPPFIQEMTALVRDAVSQVVSVFGTKGRQMQVAAHEVYKSVCG